jgi:predicted transcriptional regulator
MSMSLKCEIKTHRFCHLYLILSFVYVLFNTAKMFIVLYRFQVVDAKVIQLDYNNSRIFLSLKDVKVLEHSFDPHL